MGRSSSGWSTRRGIAYGSAGLLAGALLVLGWRALWFLTDDAFIHFRYVGNSVLGHGYVFNPPPFRPVEGYTSFLWVLILESIWRVGGVLPPDSANVVSLLFSLLTLFLTGWVVVTFPLCGRLERSRFGIFVLVLAGLVSNRTFVTWTSSGLETALLNFLVLAWVVTALRLADAPTIPRAVLLATTAALLHLTRPEGMVFAAATAAVLALRGLERWRRGDWRWSGVMSALPLLAIPVHLLWRVSFYGEWLPNTYYAKHVAPWPVAGFHYAFSYALEHATWVWVLAFAVLGPGVLARGVRAARESGWSSDRALAAAIRTLAVATATFVVGYYTFVIGGDTFEYRIYGQLVPLLLLSLLWLLNARGLGPGLTLATLAAYVLLGCPIAWIHWRLASEIPPDTAANEDVNVTVADSLPGPLRWYGMLFDGEQAWLYEHVVCGRHHGHLHFTESRLRMFPERQLEVTMPLDDIPVIVDGAVGVTGWALPQVAVIDVLGLTDYVAARTPVPRGQSRQMAHDRRAPKAYLAEFRPNVRILRRGRFRAEPREEGPLTAADVIETERRWWAIAQGD